MTMKANIKTLVGTFIVDPNDASTLRFVKDGGDPRGQVVNPVWVRQEMSRRRRKDPEYTLGELADALNVPLVATGYLDPKHLPAGHPDRHERTEHERER